MKILFVHQNFPAQFKHLAPELVRLGHEVKALAINRNSASPGVEIFYYKPLRSSTLKMHPWLLDFETKVIRGEAAYFAALKMSGMGFAPDLIVAHPGWGESLFLKDVWPNARLALYAEFYYQNSNSDLDFDPEFETARPGEPCRVRIKNANHDLHFLLADAAISPTQFQRSTFPAFFQQKISVLHDGIDTQRLRPDPDAQLWINKARLSRQDPVITFVNRNLEPMRGYHIFMRALPEILRKLPKAQILIVGGNEVSYGKNPPQNKTWRDIFSDEVREEIDLSRVHFLGRIPYPDFIKLLQISTVHVYLTYPFVLSWSLLEAMSIGCAIVASETPPVREVLSHDETAKLVDFFNIGGLTEQIVSLMNDPLTRGRLGEEARKHAVSHYDLKNICLPRQVAWLEGVAKFKK